MIIIIPKAVLTGAFRSATAPKAALGPEMIPKFSIFHFKFSIAATPLMDNSLPFLIIIW